MSSFSLKIATQARRRQLPALHHRLLAQIVGLQGAVAWSVTPQPQTSVTELEHLRPGPLEHLRPGPLSGGSRHAQLLGYDVLRLAAMALVALQHLLTLSDYEPGSWFLGLDPGQLGVTVFCAMSGYLSLRTRGGSTSHWLRRRLKKVYLPLWVSLPPLLLGNAIVNYKPMSLGLIVSEFAGTSYFTHPGEIVGVYLWFISLILVCYWMAAVIRLAPMMLPVFALGTAGMLRYGDMLPPHILSFLAGAVVALGHRRWAATLGTVAATFLLSRAYDVGFVFPLAGSLALLLAALPWGPSPPWASKLSQATYEFYLVHGPIYLAGAKFLGLNVMADAILGTGLAVLATWLLRRVVQLVATLLPRFERSVRSDL